MVVRVIWEYGFDVLEQKLLDAPEIAPIIKLSNQTIILLCDFWSTILSQIDLDYEIT